MSIPISSIVNINPRLIKAGQTGLELNGLFLTINKHIPTDARVLEFENLDDINAYFGETSDEYDKARIYFQGYDDSFKKPARVYFGRHLENAAAPYIRGAEVTASLADVKALGSTSSLKIMIGSTEASVSPNFSNINSYSEAARAIQTSIQAHDTGGDDWEKATVEYNSHFKAFIITGGKAGVSSGIGYAEGTAAAALALTKEAGSLLSQGAEKQTISASLNTILTKTDNFVSLTTLFTVTEDTALEIVKWVNSKGVRYNYCYWSSQAALTIQGVDTTIGTTLQELSPNGTCTVYGDCAYAAFIMGTLASIDYNRSQGAITTAFLSQAGLEINVRDSAVATALNEKGFNWYGDYAENNSQFTCFYPGQMYGKYKWIDTYINAVWLNARLQLSLMTMLKSRGRLPYTEMGYTLVRAAMQDPINAALNAGVIDPGVTLSESQKAQITSEAGEDISSNLDTDGYFIQVLDPGATVRANRETPVANLWYTYGGAIQKLTINSTAVE